MAASEVEAVAAELAARRLAKLSGRREEDAGFWRRAIQEALPREVEVSPNVSKVLGIAFENSFYFLNKNGFEHGSRLTNWEQFVHSSGWVRYDEDDVPIDSFVLRFDGGFVVAGSFSSSACWIRLMDPKMASRLLYPNPVCIVTAGSDCCMTLSWLTMVGNDGCFVFSMNKSRRTAVPVCINKLPFQLSVVAAGFERVLLDIGSRNHGKRERARCDEEGFVRNAVARVAARVDAILDDSRGHYVARAQILEAHVLSSYWVDGKLFAPSTPTTPPLLSFVGSKQFAKMTIL